MKKPAFVLAHDTARSRACAAINDPAFAGWLVQFKEPKQSDIQRERYHAMIDDIAEHEPHFTAEVWKRLLVDQFKAETNNHQFERLRDYWRRVKLEMMPSLDGQRMIVLGEQTRDFPKFVSSAFIEFLFAWGADKGVIFKEPAAKEFA